MQWMKGFLGLMVGVILLMTTAVDAAPGPSDQVRATVEAAMDILKESHLDTQARRARLSSTIRSRFNFNEMSQRILALNWSSANAQQRERFVTLFSDLLERNYIGRIEAYTDEKIDFVKERIQGNRAAVDTVIATKNAEIPISYRMVQNGAEWQVYDVVIESVSFVNNYRSSYGEIVKKEGFDGLLAKMEEKLADLEKNGNPTEP